MSGKLNPSAPARNNDPVKSVDGLGNVDQKGGWRHDCVEITGNETLPASAPESAPDSAMESARESAEYIAVLASQLQRIAETNGHEFLTYLIEMTVVEAWRIAGPDADPPDKNANGAGGN
jgi:hypothetical protein